MVGRDPPDPREVADPGVGKDQARVGKLAGELHGVQSQRRDSPSGVDQHRQRALVRKRDHRLDARIVERELLRAWMQLDAPGARVEVDAADVITVRDGAGAGKLERLTAPSLQSTTGVALGGLSIPDGTADGRLSGTPVSEAVTPSGHTYRFKMPAASAAMLTVSIPAEPAG